jgi:hypothetical protein
MLAPVLSGKVLLQALGHFAAAAVPLMFFVPRDSLSQRRFSGHSVILVPDPMQHDDCSTKHI